MSARCDICGGPLDEKVRTGRAILIWGRDMENLVAAYRPMLICKANGRNDADCDRAATRILNHQFKAHDLWTEIRITEDHWRFIFTDYPWSKEDLGRLFDRYLAVRAALSEKPTKRGRAA